MSSDEVNELQEKIRFYETILDNIYNGVMITDPDKWQVLPFGMKS